jgi:hypothetical protein
MVGGAIPENMRDCPSVESSMRLYPLPQYLGLSSDMLVSLTDKSITKI